MKCTIDDQTHTHTLQPEMGTHHDWNKSNLQYKRSDLYTNTRLQKWQKWSPLWPRDHRIPGDHSFLEHERDVNKERGNFCNCCRDSSPSYPKTCTQYPQSAAHIFDPQDLAFVSVRNTRMRRFLISHIMKSSCCLHRRIPCTCCPDAWNKHKICFFSSKNRHFTRPELYCDANHGCSNFCNLCPRRC